MVKITFSLAWLKSGKSVSTAFKHPPYVTLIDEFRGRLERFSPCEIKSGLMQGETKGPGIVNWFCHPGQGKSELSSEELAAKIKGLEIRGTKALRIHIGGPDGFSAERLKAEADFIWSFGRLTLPHELATLVAVEQVYRAYTINAGNPYHLGH